jgi:hypothetical protein
MAVTNAMVVGDSHTSLFQWIQKRNLCPDFSFNVLLVKGATAYGATSLLSRSQFIAKASEFITCRQREERVVFIMLGEIDCNIAARIHAEQKQVTLGKHLEHAAEKVVDFASRIVRPVMSDSRVVLLHPTLPCVKDEHLSRGIKSRRFGCEPLRCRTSNTHVFCYHLSRIAADNNLVTESINDLIVDKDTGLLRKEYMRADGGHHLRNRQSYGLWLSRIEKYNSWG